MASERRAAVDVIAARQLETASALQLTSTCVRWMTRISRLPCVRSRQVTFIQRPLARQSLHSIAVCKGGYRHNGTSSGHHVAIPFAGYRSPLLPAWRKTNVYLRQRPPHANETRPRPEPFTDHWPAYRARLNKVLPPEFFICPL